MERMGRIAGKKWPVLLLVLFLSVSQAGSVFAAEAGISENAGVSTELPEVGPSEEALKTASENNPGENEIISENTVSSDTVTPSDETAEATKEEAASANHAGVDAVSDAGEEGRILESLGLCKMPEGFVLSDAEIKKKQAIKDHNVTGIIEKMEAGEGYVEDEIVFAADSEEYAKEVAKAYNATLESYGYKIAIAKIDTEKLTVKQAVEAGCSQLMSHLPPVEPNYICKLDDPIRSDDDTTVTIEEKNSILAAKRAENPRDWEYWQSAGYNDPALDPFYTYTDNDSNTTKNGYQWMHDMVGSYEAWGVATGKGVTVAVIDTGVYSGHEDLSGSKVTHANNVVSDHTDSVGHGTHVAGIVAANGKNGKGGVGIAPDAKILDVPIFTGNKGSYETSNLIRGINYVTSLGSSKVQVINMSLGGWDYNYELNEACKNAHDSGITVIVAMGNDYTNEMKYPACCDGVIAVAAVDIYGQKTDFSTYGNWCDIAAPGDDIFSSWNGHTETNTTNDHTYYANWDGTSMAAPVVAGACALYIEAAGGSADPDDVKKALKKSAKKVSGSYKLGAGILYIPDMLPEDITAPVLTTNAASLKELKTTSTLTLSDSSEAKGNTLYYLYSINGQNPSMSDGIVKNGIKTSGNITVSNLIDNYGLEVGKEVTLKAVRINGLGKAGKVLTEKIKVDEEPETKVRRISIYGPQKAARGKSVQFAASVSPLYLSKTKLKWEVEGDGVTINSNSGKVKIDKKASGSFTVYATALDEGGVKSGGYTVEIVEPASELELTLNNYDNNVNIPEYKKGILKSLRLYNVDIPDNNNTENKITVKASADNSCGISYSSSNPAVATVYGGTIIGNKAGKTKITARATDGSNKKISFDVQVIVPASMLSIKTPSKQSTVSYGKKMKLLAVPENTYGEKVSIRKVSWEEKPVKVVGYNGNNQTDVTSACNEKNYVKIKNGTVTVNKNISKLGDSYDHFVISVKASTTDGTGLEETIDIMSFKAPTVAVWNNRRINSKYYANYGYNNIFITDFGVEYTIKTESLLYEMCPEIISSNPKSSGKIQIEGFDIVTLRNGKTVNVIYYVFAYPDKKGKSKITGRVSDGSGKSGKFSMRLY